METRGSAYESLLGHVQTWLRFPLSLRQCQRLSQLYIFINLVTVSQSSLRCYSFQSHAFLAPASQVHENWFPTVFSTISNNLNGQTAGMASQDLRKNHVECFYHSQLQKNRVCDNIRKTQGKKKRHKQTNKKTSCRYLLMLVIVFSLVSTTKNK